MDLAGVIAEVEPWSPVSATTPWAPFESSGGALRGMGAPQHPAIHQGGPGPSQPPPSTRREPCGARLRHPRSSPSPRVTVFSRSPLRGREKPRRSGRAHPARCRPDRRGPACQARQRCGLPVRFPGTGLTLTVEDPGPARLRLDLLLLDPCPGPPRQRQPVVDPAVHPRMLDDRAMAAAGGWTRARAGASTVAPPRARRASAPR